jgi:GT2 family glycosyltransferase
MGGAIARASRTESTRRPDSAHHLKRVHLPKCVHMTDRVEGGGQDAEGSVDGVSEVPLVSVVVPCFNTAESFLLECLRSLQTQTRSDWEAIVVDDASTRTDVGKIVSTIGDPRFRAIRHDQNRERGAARNTGFRVARGSLFLCLDADDRLHPEFLEATVDSLERHPEADWVLTDFQLFGASDDVWRLPHPLRPICPAHMPYVGAGVLMRRRVWEEVGGFAEHPSLTDGADLDFWLSVVERGFQPFHVSRPLYWYRRHAESTTATKAMYDSSVQCELIYRRHRRAFETLGGDCPLCQTPNRAAAFRAQAFLTSSSASLSRGERLRALRLALRALTLQPRNRQVARQLRRVIRSSLSAVLGRRGRRGARV